MIKPNSEDILERTRAAVALLNTGRRLRPEWSQKADEMFAFLSLFHPEMSLEERIRLAVEAI